MTDRDGFLAAIIAQPDDDVPRLVYADWLDEHGDPERAELIRVQCELERLPEPEIKTMGVPRDDPRWHRDGFCPKCPCRYHALRRRERELLKAKHPIETGWTNQVVWGRSVDHIATVPYCVEFHRGFVEVITCSWEDWAGVECPNCDVSPGIRRYATHSGDWIEDECNHCSGSSRIGGHADAIRAATPLRLVKFADRPTGIGFEVVHDTTTGRTYRGHRDYPGIEFELPRVVDQLVRLDADGMWRVSYE